MSAAALNLLMMNFNSQLQQESGLHLNNANNNNNNSNNSNNTAQQQHGGVPQGFNPSYSQHHQQQHHQQQHQQQQQQQQQQHQQQHQYMSVDRLDSAILIPTGSPVRQLKRLHPGATNTATELLRCRRRIELSSNTSYPNMHHYETGYSAMPPRQVSSVARRNERERNRVRLVNHGFALLRQHVPSTAARSKKMSKVDTLKAAVDYIQQLRDLLEDADATVEDRGVEGEEEAGERSPASTVSSSGFSSNQENTHQFHHHRHHQEDGSLSPASSCPDGSSSPGGYSSSGSEDGASSTSCLALHARAVQYQHQRHLQGAREDDDDLHLEEFASWFC